MIAIINTGGTFNKVYDPIRGELTIPRNDDAPRRALESMRGLSFEIEGLIYKDSLDMDDADRLQLCRHIQSSKSSRIVVIHGTDTIHLSAAALKE
jgi:L-asparaginase